MAVVSQRHTFTNASATARKVGGFLIKSGESAKVPLADVTKSNREDVTKGVFSVAPALPPTIEDRDQATFELSLHGLLAQSVSGVGADVPTQMPFKASALVSAVSSSTGGGAASVLDPNDVSLKNDDTYDLTEVVFATDQSLNDVLLLFRP